MKEKCILITGGARSGKSHFAQDLASNLNEDVLFVATAESFDSDMEDRIQKHRRERPASWRTLEIPMNIAEKLRSEGSSAKVILIDCLTLLVSNLVLKEDRHLPEPGDIREDEAERRLITEIQSLCNFIETSKATVIIVSNEVGLGIVPDNRLSRIYRDLLGQANRIIAEYSDEVYWMIAGIPQKIKG